MKRGGEPEGRGWWEWQGRGLIAGFAVGPSIKQGLYTYEFLINMVILSALSRSYPSVPIKTHTSEGLEVSSSAWCAIGHG